MKHKSEVNSKYVIKEDLWVVSVLNSGDTRLHLGHSFIVVEGFSEDSLFVGHYDLKTDEISNIRVVSEIRCFESTKCNYPQPYSTLPSSSYHADPDNVCDMIKSIKQDIDKTAKAQKPDEYIQYSFTGRDHFLFKFFKENNINCADWCIEKLKIALPSLEYSGTAKPKFLAGIQTGRNQEQIEEIKSTMPVGCNIL